MPTSSINELTKLIALFPPEIRKDIEKAVSGTLPIWVPLPGQQTMAYESLADVLFYGGSAGGAKSDLLLGLTLTKHSRSIIFRREATQLQALTDRLLIEIVGSREGWNGTEHTLRIPGRQIEFGSCKDVGDEIKYQGRPHDLIGFDEICHFLKSQFQFLCGWNRTNVAGQRCRILCTGNPPTTQDGRWVIDYWGPWLDPNHPNPAKPGDLRWYAMLPGAEHETPVEDGTPFEHNGKLITPKSRTFIPSKVTDNPFLMATGYEATLQAMPEPLRSQMLEGNFQAGVADDEWQVIPTKWVELAQARWTPEGRKGEADSCGVDVARGGSAKTVISLRHGNWYDKLVKYPGKDTPDGAVTAGLIITHLRDAAPIHIDVGEGAGGEALGHLDSNGFQVIGINGADTESVDGQLDRATKRLKFRNLRAMLYWRFREALEPDKGDNIALPPDTELKAALCTPKWKLTTGGILIESKIEIRKRLGGLWLDEGDAVVYCSVITQKINPKTRGNWRTKRGSWRSVG